MKAIVGLGNPGDEYKGTRHNVGFDVVDELTRRWKTKLKKWRTVADLSVVKDRNVVLVEPRTYMNDSGRAVSAVMTFYKIQPSDVLVVVDEVQLPLGKLRLRPSGSAGGHNGLKSVIEHVGQDFPRLRIGIDRGDLDWDLRDRVLSRFPPVERDIVSRAIVRAADAVETFLLDGIFAAMNKFNAVSDNLQSEI
ncbi:MAG: aminoacyl-tRNA hydrolase [Acidobacteria bacterium]|nr:aminoacyl-tRNA hydrolase [Acidobacteriota bacterium]